MTESYNCDEMYYHDGKKQLDLFQLLFSMEGKILEIVRGEETMIYCLLDE